MGSWKLCRSTADDALTQQTSAFKLLRVAHPRQADAQPEPSQSHSRNSVVSRGVCREVVEVVDEPEGRKEEEEGKKGELTSTSGRVCFFGSRGRVRARESTFASFASFRASLSLQMPSQPICSVLVISVLGARYLAREQCSIAVSMCDRAQKKSRSIFDRGGSLCYDR